MEEVEATSSEQDPAEPPNFKVRKQFLNKLFNLLEENKYSDIICWTEDGEKFIIKDPTSAAKYILPKLFNHSNYSSFTRQLSFYRFKRYSDKPDSRIYCHPNFKSGRFDLLEHIERAKHAPISKDKKEKNKAASKQNFEYERVQLISRIYSLTEQLESTRDYVHHLEDENAKLRLQLKDELERDYRARELLASLESTSRVQRPRFLERFRVKPCQQAFTDPSASNTNNLLTLPISHGSHTTTLLSKANLKGYEVKTQNVSHLVVNPQKPRYLLNKHSSPSPQEVRSKRQSIDYHDTMMFNDVESSFLHTDDDDFFASAHRTSDTPKSEDDLMGFGDFPNSEFLAHSITRQQRT